MMLSAARAPCRGGRGPLAARRDRLDRVGTDVVGGVVLHTGDRRVALGDRLVGLPIADLWT